jgi:hypothetical protein
LLKKFCRMMSKNVDKNYSNTSIYRYIRQYYAEMNTICSDRGQETRPSALPGLFLRNEHHFKRATSKKVALSHFSAFLAAPIRSQRRLPRLTRCGSPAVCGTPLSGYCVIKWGSQKPSAVLRVCVWRSFWNGGRKTSFCALLLEGILCRFLCKIGAGK